MLLKLGTSLLFSSLVCVVIGQVLFDCEEGFCQKKDNACPEVNCTNGRLLKNTTNCGCCHICIKSLREGQPCKTQYYTLSGVERDGECGSGLICHSKRKVCVPANTNCINKRKYPKVSIYRRQVLPEFDCDDFGFFNHTICIPGVLCHCVDRSGSRIFGTDLEGNKKSMKCDCSQQIEDFTSNRFAPDEYLPQCLPNGNYDPIQCSDELCFCTDKQSIFQNYDININSSMRELPCYKREIHENRPTNCQLQRAKEMEIFKNKTFKAVIGRDLTRCDLDGSYFPRQCKKDRCFCVNRNGDPYTSYEVSRNEMHKMTCRCLRDKDILKDATENRNRKLFKQIECDRFGNYGPNTVIESVLFKIDENGI